MKATLSFPSARAVVAVVLAVGGLGLLSSACNRGRDADDPSDQQPANVYGPQQPGQYPQQYPQQPGQYPQQYPQQQPQQPQAGAAAPAATGAAPSPIALPCQNDLVCGTHKCNVQAGRCAFPCAANTDCAAGFSCMGAGGPTAICVPGGAPQ